MTLKEVVRTCTHSRVAEAALASIGGAVAARVSAEASGSGVSSGVLVAALVREFDEHSCPSVRASVEQAMRGSEQPVLTGLQHVLGHALLRRVLSGRAEAIGASATSSMERTLSEEFVLGGS